MNKPSRRIKSIAAAGAMGAVTLLGVATASSASAATVSSSTSSTRLATPAVTSSLKLTVWQPPYGCFVCGLGGFDPSIDWAVNPAIPQQGF